MNYMKTFIKYFFSLLISFSSFNYLYADNIELYDNSWSLIYFWVITSSPWPREVTLTWTNIVTISWATNSSTWWIFDFNIKTNSWSWNKYKSDDSETIWSVLLDIRIMFATQLILIISFLFYLYLQSHLWKK